MSTKGNGFAAMGQSLLSMGENVISGNPIPSKPKKKNHKKKNNKSKESLEANHHQVALESDVHVDDNFGDWQSQSKPKKSKAKMNGESLNGSLAPAPINDATSIPVPPSAPKRAKKLNNGSEQSEKNELKSAILNKTVNTEKVVPTSTPVPVPQPQKQSELVKGRVPVAEILVSSHLDTAVSSTKPQTKRPQRNSETSASQDMSFLFAYTRHLEHSLAVGCGSATVEAVRSSHPNLTFSSPVPASPSPSSQIPDISDNPTKSEIVDLKALLLAKQSEVIFYKNMLSRQNQPAIQPFIEEKKPMTVKKPKEVASKDVQCDPAEIPQQQVPSSAPQPSTQATIEKSLLDQILFLSNESTRFKQRCDIANRDVEELKKECSKLEAECKKIKTKTAKETKELVKKEFDAFIEKLQGEISEKDAQITDKSAQIDSLQDQLEHFKAGVTLLEQSERASMTRLVELEMTVNNLTTQKETVLLEKGDLTKTVEKVTSEMSWLKHTLTEKESELAQAKGECSNLLTELDATKVKLETISLAHQEAEKEISTSGETIERLKGEITLLKSDLSAKEEELSVARAEAAARQEELDQVKEDLAHKVLELTSAQKELEKVEKQHQERDAVHENDAPAECKDCFVLTEANTELKGALEKTREELLSLQSSLEESEK
ncbi:unnamed protein product [Hymenolepis diminuta]|uniref:TMF_TATA_bd domain-containing protein n=1 Tax=Hymenolepis diminuta TaxID=6216 RepID=A0A0R3SH90_HYMDI|nr:unnamed protein product [Hymenolepis diminuta]